MNVSVFAQPGNHFVLTDLGKSIGRIKVKYDEGRKNRSYDHTVPKAWVENGYVIEVKEELHE